MLIHCSLLYDSLYVTCAGKIDTATDILRNSLLLNNDAHTFNVIKKVHCVSIQYKFSKKKI